MSKIADGLTPFGKWNRAIAVDGGTTNTRARLVREGRIVVTARRAVGVRDTVLLGRFNEGECCAPQGLEQIQVRSQGLNAALVQAVREAVNEVLGLTADTAVKKPLSVPSPLIVAAGMLSSEVGLVTVPHVHAPAGIDELAEGMLLHTIPEIASEAILFVPGVRTVSVAGPEGWMSADIMRGEECETLGALSQLRRRGMIEEGQAMQAFLWPGSHTKLVEVDAKGRITRSHTTLAGEFIAAVAHHTLIAASLPGDLPTCLDDDAADAGARASLEHGLGRAAFLVRLAALQDTLSPNQRAAFWIGAVVAEDVFHLVQHSILASAPPLWVGGSDPLRSLYARLMKRYHSGSVIALNEELAAAASALGALEIAARREDRLHDQDVSVFAKTAP
jgi:2-dehydro-3-deoxygalactonokinase